MSLAVGERFALKRSLAYPGWTMVFVSFVSIAFVFAASTASMPLLYGPVIDEFGWSRTQTTLIFTYKNAASAVAALFFIGPLCERFGLRRVTVGAFVTTALAMTSFLWVDTLWSYHAAGAVLGLGIAATFVTAKVLVSRWFVANQGFAIGVVLAGASFGGAIAPLVYERLNEAIGWRGAFAALSVGIWAVALPLYLAKAKEHPTASELARELRQPLVSDEQGAPEMPSDGRDFGDLMRTPMMWWLVLSLLLVASADAGLMQHTALFLERDAGLSTSAVASAISATLGLGVVAKAAAGWIFDRYSLRGIGVWYLLLAASIALALSVHGALTLTLFVAVRGVAHGGLMTEPALVAKHCYGPRFMNRTVPLFIGVWATGAAIGPVIMAVTYDFLGSYRTGLLLLIAFSVVAAVVLRRVQPLYRDAWICRQRSGR